MPCHRSAHRRYARGLNFRDGDSLRVFHQIKHRQKLRHELIDILRGYGDSDTIDAVRPPSVTMSMLSLALPRRLRFRNSYAPLSSTSDEDVKDVEKKLRTQT